MATLYVASTERLAGKTAFCIALARQLRSAGQNVGYMKPVTVHSRLENDVTDEDAVYIKTSLTLCDELETIAPVNLRPDMLEGLLMRADGEDLIRDLKGAYGRVAERRDAVLLEAGGNLREGAMVKLSPPEIARLLPARSLLVIKYESDQQLMDDALVGGARLGESFIGVVLNCVPRPELRFAEEVAKPALEKRGVAVFAVLPLERLLQSVAIGRLAESLSGDVLCCQDAMDDLVEHVMVGAMSAASALSYFRKKPNKAVITGWDRTDIQYAALETSTKCLVLTGNQDPPAGVLHRAEEVGVPLIRVRQDTMAAVDSVQRAFGGTRCHHARKVERFEEMLRERLDLGRLEAAMMAE